MYLFIYLRKNTVMKYINRDLEKQISKWLFKNKILIIYGARQVGKTTLVKRILNEKGNLKNYFNCEELSTKDIIESANAERMKMFFGDNKLIVLDEAQKIQNIGLNMKIFHDRYPEIQIIATGSSSFDLSNKINEPLTGRALDFFLLPISINEILKENNYSVIDSSIDRYLRFGMYPEIISKDDESAKFIIENISSKYLYKDILELEFLKKPEMLLNLLKLLSYQLGNEVSKNELANKLQTSRQTIEKYLTLLEKVFIIYRLKPFSRNLRNEINKKEKIYFYDLGIRNSLISDFRSADMRYDKGALWENFCIIERIKYFNNFGIKNNYYYWRTTQKDEIDLIEENDGKIRAYEFKWTNPGNFKRHRNFIEAYKPAEYKLISRNMISELLVE